MNAPFPGAPGPGEDAAAAAEPLAVPVRRLGRRPPEEVLGVVVLVLLVGLTLANVVVRYFTSQSFAWTEEFSVFLMVVLTLAGSALAARHDVHLRVEFFYARGSAARRAALVAMSTLAVAGLFGLLAILLARAAWSEFQFGETTIGLGVPRWWYTACLPLLALLVAARALTHGIAELKVLGRRKDGAEA